MDPTRMPFLAAPIRNPLFLSAALSLFTAQFAKALISLLGSRARSFRDVMATLLWRTGGMPSSHSALAVSISTAAAFNSGPSSDLFALSVFFSLVVIRDALGVRRSAGVQAKALNTLGSRVGKRLHIAFKPVKEIHGHTLPQVIVGSLLGFFIALAVCTL
ncbi:MAG TPA: divergent PAP2 family protein [Spirochaetales bacterium]|nr:divergent PAP2 family protein [Spirochaetales bacterium]